MTYGWAILIIAVVLGVLFQLGVFSGSALTPKAAPGACQVVRLGGQVSLEGECQGQLPQYVAQSLGGSSSLSEISVQPSSTLLSVNTQNAFTVALWFRTTNPSSSQTIFTTYYDEIRLGASSTLFPYVDFGTHNDRFSGGSPALGKWYFLAITKDTGGNGVIYINGTQDGGTLTGLPAVSVGNNSPLIGIGYEIYGGANNNRVYGSIANVQFYNTSLSSNEIKALYLEGIGGAPVRIQSLVGWWPLNGNANDYSGNNNNGQISSNITFNSTWNAQYTPP